MNSADQSLDTCQHCHKAVVFTKPIDAGYKAFAHVQTNTVACPK